MFQYSLLSVLVSSCIFFSCGNVNIPKIPKIDNPDNNTKTDTPADVINKKNSHSKKTKTHHTWEILNWLADLPDDLFQNEQEKKANFNKALSATDKTNFHRKAYSSQRKDLLKQGIYLLHIAFLKQKEQLEQKNKEIEQVENKKIQIKQLFQKQKEEIQKLKAELDKLQNKATI